MHELNRDSFYKARPLLEGGHPHPEIISIIEHHNPGWIFADSGESPRSALVWSKGIQGFYLIGDDANDAFTDDLDHFIRTALAPRMKELGMQRFEVSGHGDQWELTSLFASRELQMWDQIVYGSTDGKPGQAEFSVNDRIRTVDLRSEEWRNRDFSNKAFVNDHLGLFWDEADFDKKGYGHAAIVDTQIIGVCYSSFVTNETHAIGIEILPRYHRQGAGTLLASLVMQNIVENGYAPYWDCSQSNEASNKLALRLGLQQVHRYQCAGFAV